MSEGWEVSQRQELYKALGCAVFRLMSSGSEGVQLTCTQAVSKLIRAIGRLLEDDDGTLDLELLHVSSVFPRRSANAEEMLSFYEILLCRRWRALASSSGASYRGLSA
ncbi:hypothetical protein HH1059_17730 [Halorhodospira halochloris]|uniref:Uncharacterized protein n=1 Tax=Halorhodospira halochloris TaxID=1052 RepID=A0A0X8XAK9_HALHR|nr:hypothetical protein [Halorhodospira halochloris]MBK1651599.1 hypothetical protein [Halorhodospira halochloris]BAU58460.1 hypothetical protein HH1059_17730 [Halorhodospira halochloris]